MNNSHNSHNSNDSNDSGNSLSKSYSKVVTNTNRIGNTGDGASIYKNWEIETNIFDTGDKLTQLPEYKLKDIINLINKTKKWTLIEIKNVADDLWQYYIIVVNKYKNDPKKQKELTEYITYYIKYLEHQSRYLNFFSNNILTLVATIFLPLTFITGFFGMNFKSMGVPSLKKGIFNIKHADAWIGGFSIICVIVMIFQFNQVYHIFS